MNFNEKLLNLRKQKGWSQEELGYKLDVSRQTISKWEAGRTTPELEKLKLLARIFEISVDELINNGEEGFTEKVSNKIFKKKRILPIIIALILAIYVIIVFYRVYVIWNFNLEMTYLTFSSYESFYLEKYNRFTSFDSSKCNSEKVEYYHYKSGYDENGKWRQIQKNIYHNGLVSNPREIIYEVSTYDNENEKDIFDVIKINVENNTYSKSNEDEGIINSDIIYEIMQEWYNQFNFNFKQNRLLTALDFRIKIFKSKDGYYISDYNKNAYKNGDSLEVTIKDNRLVATKITHEKQGEHDYTKTVYKLKAGSIVSSYSENGFKEVQVMQLEDSNPPDLSNYTLVEN